MWVIDFITLVYRNNEICLDLFQGWLYMMVYVFVGYCKKHKGLLMRCPCPLSLKGILVRFLLPYITLSWPMYTRFFDMLAFLSLS